MENKVSAQFHSFVHPLTLLVQVESGIHYKDKHLRLFFDSYIMYNFCLFTP